MRNQLKYLLTIPVIFHATASAQPDGWEVFELNEKKLNVYIQKEIKRDSINTYFSTLTNYDKPQREVFNKTQVVWKSMIKTESISCESRMRQTWAFVFYSEHNGSGFLVHKFDIYAWSEADRATYFPPYRYSNDEWNRRGFEKKFCKKAWEIWR